MNKKKIIAIFLPLSLFLLFISVVSKSTNKNSVNSTLSTTLKVPLATMDLLNIKTEPAFDFTYYLIGDTLTIRSISLLVENEIYLITVTYKDSAGQTLIANSRLIYNEDSKASSFLGDSPVTGDGFDLYQKNRHSFNAVIFNPNYVEKKVIDEAGSILKKYNIDPNSVEINIEVSSSAKGEPPSGLQ